MFADDVRKMTDEQILDAIEDNKEALYVLRRDYSTGELKDTSQFKKARRDIARLRTVLRERQLAADLAQQEASDA